MTETRPSGWIALAAQMRATELGLEDWSGCFAAVGCDNERRAGRVAVHEHDFAAIGHPRGPPSVWRDSPHRTTFDVTVKRPPPSSSERKTRRWPFGDQAG